MLMFASAMLVAGLAACSAAETRAEQNAYSLDDLQRVYSVLQFEMDDWEPLDDSAMIVSDHAQRHFLIVLQTPNPRLMESNHISVSLATNRVSSSWASYDSPIEAIYRVEPEQLPSVRSRIRNAPQDS